MQPSSTARVSASCVARPAQSLPVPDRRAYLNFPQGRKRLVAGTFGCISPIRPRRELQQILLKLMRIVECPGRLGRGSQHERRLDLALDHLELELGDGF